MVFLFLAACASPPTGTPSDNGAPSSATIAVGPAWPADGDTLTCSIVGASVDPDGDVVTYRFAWSVDGTDVGITDDTVAASLTSEGQQWTCIVTPTDGELDGPSTTAVATVGPAAGAPSAPLVRISPAAPTDDRDLECSVETESVDPDGDLVAYRFAWSVDGVDAGLGGSTVDHERTEPGQTWTCTVTATDGTYESAGASDSVVILEGTQCSGTPPVITALTVEPGDTTTFEDGDWPTLGLQASTSDTDGDLHEMSMSVWSDDVLDGHVDTGGEPLSLSAVMAPEACSAENTMFNVLFKVDGGDFDFATPYEFAVVVYDAAGLASAVAYGTGTTPSAAR